MNEYVHKIIKTFMAEFPVAHSTMKATDHNDKSKGFVSDWHIEGDVWTHTMMVVANAVTTSHYCYKNKKELVMAALLHDVGKCFTREYKEEKNKVTFYGHPGVSTFIAADMIDKLDPDFTEEQKIFTLRLINYHQVLFGVTDDMSAKSYKKLFEKFDSHKGEELLGCVQELRVSDYAGNLSMHNDKVGYQTMARMFDELHDKYFKAEQTFEVKDESKPEAIIIVGLPGSGKSHYINEHYSGHVVVSRDDQLMKLAGDLTYNEAWNVVDQKTVDEMFEMELYGAIKAKEDLVIDRTNLTNKGRMKFIRRLADAGYDVKVVVLMTDLMTIDQRNQQREGKVISEDVIKGMMCSFEMPFENEGEVEYIFNY